MSTYFENRVSSNIIDSEILNDMNFSAHWHTDIELMYVCEGNIRVGINEESRILKQGDLAVFNSKDIHYYDSKNLHSKILVIIFNSNYLNTLYFWPKNLYFSSQYINKEVLELFEGNIPNILEAIFQENNIKKDFYELFINSKILELFTLLFRHCPTYSIESCKNNKTLFYTEAIQEAIRYIEDNYQEDISLEEIAEKVKFSPTYFSTLFKKYCGVNFKAYLNNMRIAKAEMMIKNSDKNILNIAYELGFNSIRAFNRTFKAVKGYTPSSLRK
jgi:AraC-like DNA-binding protein